MIEQVGDLFEQRCYTDAICITVNRSIRKDGAAVMGRGTAASASARWTGIAHLLGEAIRTNGSVVRCLTTTHGPTNTPIFPFRPQLGLQWHVVAFPVKHEWFRPADPELIQRSAHQLVTLTTGRGWTRVVLVRPGCGAGQLNWADVKPRIASILDDRFVVVERATP